MTSPHHTIGVVGFGVMGSSMARNLIKGGHTVLGASRTLAKVTALVPDGIVPSTHGEIASRCDTVLLSVQDGASVEEVLFGADGIAPRLASGSLIIDTTTIAPEEAVELAARCVEYGVSFLDAPVSGGDVGARNGTLTIMCGGTEECFERALPILRCLGKKILRMGPSGAGQAMKAVNQIAVGLGIVAMTESLLLAEKLGLDAQVALEVLQGSAAGSWALANYAPRLLAGDLKPGFDAAHMLKDLRIALASGSDTVSLPGTELATTLFERLVAEHPGLGNHALKKAYKK
jgi:3-hydroxyisobutyrate dehydrogenase